MFLIVLFFSNLPQPKIIRIIFSDLIRRRLLLLSHRTTFTIKQKPVSSTAFDYEIIINYKIVDDSFDIIVVVRIGCSDLTITR